MLFFLVLKFQAGHGINYVLFDISKPIIGIFLNASMLCIYFFLISNRLWHHICHINCMADRYSFLKFQSQSF